MQASTYDAKELLVNTATVPRERMGDVIRQAQEAEGKATKVVFTAPGNLRDGEEIADAFDGEFHWESFVGVTLKVPADKWEKMFNEIRAESPRKDGERNARYEQRLRRETDAEFRAEYRLDNPQAKSHRIRVVTTDAAPQVNTPVAG